MTFDVLTLLESPASSELRILDVELAHRYDVANNVPVLYRATYNYGYVHLDVFEIIRCTACGVWIRTPYEKAEQRFVNLKAGKQYASLSADAAIDQLYWRKRRQIVILEAQLKHSKEAYAELGRWRKRNEKE